MFDGIDDWVRIPNSNSLSQTRITLDAWVYPTGNAGRSRHIISKDNGFVTRNTVWVSVPINKFVAFVASPRGMTSEGHHAVQLNTWYHVAMTHDGQSSGFM